MNIDIEEIKKLAKEKSITEEEAREILYSLEKLATIMYDLYVKMDGKYEEE